jgi:hypothetical protein
VWPVACCDVVRRRELVVGGAPPTPAETFVKVVCLPFHVHHHHHHYCGSQCPTHPQSRSLRLGSCAACGPPATTYDPLRPAEVQMGSIALLLLLMFQWENKAGGILAEYFGSLRHHCWYPWEDPLYSRAMEMPQVEVVGVDGAPAAAAVVAQEPEAAMVFWGSLASRPPTQLPGLASVLATGHRRLRKMRSRHSCCRW